MTLLLAIKSSEGYSLISDRKVTQKDQSGYYKGEHPETKCHYDEEKKYVIQTLGNGSSCSSIICSLKNDKDLSQQNVTELLIKHAEKHFNSASKHSPVPVVTGNISFLLVEFSKGSPTLWTYDYIEFWNQINFPSWYFPRGRIEKIPSWIQPIKTTEHFDFADAKLIGSIILNEVAKYDNQVGSLEEYGADCCNITMDGTIKYEEIEKSIPKKSLLHVVCELYKNNKVGFA